MLRFFQYVMWNSGDWYVTLTYVKSCDVFEVKMLLELHEIKL